MHASRSDFGQGTSHWSSLPQHKLDADGGAGLLGLQLCPWVGSPQAQCSTELSGWRIWALSKVTLQESGALPWTPIAVNETPKTSPAAPGESVPSIWSGSGHSAEHLLCCPLPNLLDGEIRAKAKSSFSMGESSTNTIKRSEGRGLGGMWGFSCTPLRKGQFSRGKET